MLPALLLILGLPAHATSPPPPPQPSMTTATATAASGARCGAVPDADAPLRTITPAQIPAVVAEQRGCVLLLEVYASWCGTCTRSAPQVSALVERLRPLGLSTLGLSVDASSSHLLTWRKTYGREYAPIQVQGWTLAGLTDTFAALGVPFQEAIPLFALFDSQGNAVLSQTEPKNLSALEAKAHGLLRAP